MLFGFWVTTWPGRVGDAVLLRMQFVGFRFFGFEEGFGGFVGLGWGWGLAAVRVMSRGRHGLGFFWGLE